MFVESKEVEVREWNPLLKGSQLKLDEIARLWLGEPCQRQESRRDNPFIVYDGRIITVPKTQDNLDAVQNTIEHATHNNGGYGERSREHIIACARGKVVELAMGQLSGFKKPNTEAWDMTHIDTDTHIECKMVSARKTWLSWEKERWKFLRDNIEHIDYMATGRVRDMHEYWEVIPWFVTPMASIYHHRGPHVWATRYTTEARQGKDFAYFNHMDATRDGFCAAVDQAIVEVRP